MTYAKLIDRLFVEYGDETEKIHGEPAASLRLVKVLSQKNMEKPAEYFG